MALLEPDWKITKVVAFKKDTVGNFVRALDRLENTTAENSLGGYKSRSDIIGKKNSKLRYRSQGNIQTEY